tara:strand:- start:191 stop:391 length:201 start_codon:yes stop_codon:yes gene_type:complete
MPSVATQTDISTVSPSGFATWCTTHMDVADGISIEDYSPKNKLFKTLTEGVKTLTKGGKRPFRHTI